MSRGVIAVRWVRLGRCGTSTEAPEEAHITGSNTTLCNWRSLARFDASTLPGTGRCPGRGVYSIFMHGRSRMTTDPCIPTMPGGSTSGFHQPDRLRVCQARSAVRCSASRMKDKLHPTETVMRRASAPCAYFLAYGWRNTLFSCAATFRDSDRRGLYVTASWMPHNNLKGHPTLQW